LVVGEEPVAPPAVRRAAAKRDPAPRAARTPAGESEVPEVVAGEWAESPPAGPAETDGAAAEEVDPDEVDGLGAETWGAETEVPEDLGADTEGTETVGAEILGADTEGTETVGAETEGVETFGVVTVGVVTDGTLPTGVEIVGVLTGGTVTVGTETVGTVTVGTETLGSVTDASWVLGSVTAPLESDCTASAVKRIAVRRKLIRIDRRVMWAETPARDKTCEMRLIRFQAARDRACRLGEWSPATVRFCRCPDPSGCCPPRCWAGFPREWPRWRFCCWSEARPTPTPPPGWRSAPMP
jgi:hypothetical protein